MGSGHAKLLSGLYIEGGGWSWGGCRGGRRERLCGRVTDILVLYLLFDLCNNYMPKKQIPEVSVTSTAHLVT